MKWIFGAASLWSCSQSTSPLTAAEYGAQVFSDPAFSDSEFNAFACATCHAAEPDDGVRIAYSLYNSAFRKSWWGGTSPRLIDAVNFCTVYFMRGADLESDDARGRALYEYLVSVSPDRPSSALPLTIVENLATLPRGDSSRGRDVFDATCRRCHGEPHTGGGRISHMASIIPETSIEFAKENDVDPMLVVIEKVRHGQFFGIGGNMPLFAREMLSDDDLGALVAYLGL